MDCVGSEARKKKAGSVLHIFLNLFFINLEDFTEFVSGNKVSTVFIVSLSDLANQSLSGTNLQTGDIHDIPVSDN
jgi:hypothetical protein